MSKFTDWYHTPYGVLMYRYRDMRDRVNGKPLRTGMEKTTKNCPWKGLPLADYKEFMEWALEDEGFQRRFKEWEEDNWQRRSAPSAHRVDRSQGYTIDNILWMNHASKSREALEKGRKTRKKRKVK